MSLDCARRRRRPNCLTCPFSNSPRTFDFFAPLEACPRVWPFRTRCPPDPLDANRNQSWNFALATAVVVCRERDTCARLPKCYYEWCDLVVGVHEHTFSECLRTGMRFEPPAFATIGGIVGNLCSVFRCLPVRGASITVPRETNTDEVTDLLWRTTVTCRASIVE